MDYHNFPLFSRPLVIGYDNLHTHSEEKCYGQLSAVSSERTCRSIIPVYPKSNRSRKGLALCQVSIKGKDKRVREHKAWLQGGNEKEEASTQYEDRTQRRVECGETHNSDCMSKEWGKRGANNSSVRGQLALEVS